MPTHEVTHLIGRAEEMARLRAGLERALGGRPNVILVSGEVGIGKSRLVADFADSSGARVLTGGCSPVAGTALPFAPVTQALRRLAATLPAQERDRTMGTEAGELTQLLLNLVTGPPTGEPPSELPVSVSAQARLFESMLALLTRLSVDSPVVVVIEDLHWADRSTLDLLAFLAHNLTDQRALMVLTFREEEAHPDPALAGWLAELSRLPLASRLPLRRLAITDIEQLVTELTGVGPSPEELRRVHSRSDGNPLFVEHLVTASRSEGAVPATLNALLAARIAELEAPTRRVLRAMAVLGRRVPVDLLASVLDAPATEVEELLRPSLDAHIVEVADATRLGFRHPLFGEVVYAELMPHERATLHAAAARVLSSGEQGPEMGAAEIGEAARHWQAAGDLSRALRGSVDAGLTAAQVYAFGDALESFRRAVDLWDDVRPEDRETVPLDQVELLAQAGQAASLVGESTEAIALIERAIAACDDRRRSAQLHERLGAFHFIAGHGPEALAAYRAAIEQLPDDADGLRARIYAGQALQAAAWTWFDVAVEAADLALKAARAEGAIREEGVALNALGVVAAFRGDLDTGIEQLTESLHLAKKAENPDDQAVAYINLAHVLGMASRLDEAVDVCREGLATMTTVGLVRQYGSLLVANSAECLIKAGRMDEADELLASGLRQHPRGLQGAAVLEQCARLALVRGDLDLAFDRLGQARLRLDDEGAPDSWLRETWELTAELELWEGRPQAAYEAVSEGLRLLGDDEDRWLGGQLAVLGLRAVADEAAPGASGATSDRHAVRQRRDHIYGAVESLLGQESPTVEYAALDATGRAEMGRLDPQGDVAARWVDAREQWERLGRPFFAAYCGWREAEARLAAGDRSGAVAPLRAARGVAVALGSARLLDELDALARWYKVESFLSPEDAGGAEPTEDAAEAALAELGLTPREQEVLAALAAGRTNGEIADELFISVKTASVHVSNILKKLDVSGRQEAARVAHRLGLRS